MKIVHIEVSNVALLNHAVVLLAVIQHSETVPSWSGFIESSCIPSEPGEHLLGSRSVMSFDPPVQGSITGWCVSALVLVAMPLVDGPEFDLLEQTLPLDLWGQ